MRLFHPSELRSKPFDDLQPGDCFFDAAHGVLLAVFAFRTVNDPHGQLFLVPLGGPQSLIASPLRPEPGKFGVKRLATFTLKGSFHISLDPTDQTQASSTDARPLLIMRDGPTILTQVIRNRAVPMQREGFLLNLETFECDYADERRQMEIGDAPSFESWSLVFTAEPNCGVVFFQQHSPANAQKEKAA
jgi:hypothetical protein